MQQEIAPIAVRASLLNGISEQMVLSHYENTYGNAVRTLNAVRRELAALDAEYAAVPPGRAQARRALADGLGRAARALLRQPRRLPPRRTQLGPRSPRLARSAGRLRLGDRGGLRQRQCVASRVRRNGAVAGGRLRMGPPHLLAPAEAVLEPDRGRSHAGGRRRRARARSGHVRARLPVWTLARTRPRTSTRSCATSTGKRC